MNMLSNPVSDLQNLSNRRLWELLHQSDPQNFTSAGSLAQQVREELRARDQLAPHRCYRSPR